MSLVVAVVQPACRPNDRATNAIAHVAAIRGSAARLTVFPELSLTGYELDAPVVALDDPVWESLVQACCSTGSVALVGAPVALGAGAASIATVRVDGAGVAVVYRKQWLGAAETRRFTAGTGPASTEVDGWRLGLAICRDTGLAQHAADTVALGIDVYVAGVVHHRSEAALLQERARRITTAHHVYVAAASAAGPAGGEYDPAAGGSGLWAPDGTRLAVAGSQTGAMARAELD